MWAFLYLTPLFKEELGRDVTVTKSAETPRATAVQDLFAKATTDPSSLPNVSKHIKVGRRWDLTHKECLELVMVMHRGKDITTKYGEAVLADVDIEGVQKSVLFGGQVLIDQFHELAPHLPVVAVIRRPGRSYTFTDATDAEIAAYSAEYVNK